MSEEPRDKAPHNQGFIPEVPGNQRGHEEPDDQHRHHVMSEINQQIASHASILSWLQFGLQ